MSFKSDTPCKGKGGACNSLYIQNKKYHLCADCVYEKNHGGKSRQQVQMEKQKVKHSQPIIGDDEEGRMNAIKQAQVTDFDEGEVRFGQMLEKQVRGEQLKSYLKTTSAPKVKKPIIKVSSKQSFIDREYKKTCIEMDYTEEKVCSGCLRHQGGDIKLSHSHVISRQDCHNIGKPELIYDRENLRYHCMNFGHNKGCHSKWENPTQRTTLDDYQRNIKYIERVAPELLTKYKVD